jgi:hypothetical protein
MLKSAAFTDRRFSLPRQPSQVSVGNRTWPQRHKGTSGAAAEGAWPRPPPGDAQPAMWAPFVLVDLCGMVVLDCRDFPRWRSEAMLKIGTQAGRAPGKPNQGDDMGDVSIWHWFFLGAVFWVIPLWIVTRRIGRSPALSFFALIPGVFLVYVWWLAFARWPNLEAVSSAQVPR